MRSWLGRLGVSAASTILVVSATSAAFAQPPEDLVVGEDLPAPTRVQGNKAPSSALAQTDPALVRRTDSAPTQVVIKLDYDAAASYSGDIAGLPATSPAVTGMPLTGKSAAERRYDEYVAAIEADVAAALEDAVPTAEVGRSLRVVYGGVAAVIPADEVETVLEIPGVVAVQQDALHQPVTDASPEFIGAPTIYDDLGTTANAGEGIIYGNLDTGVWPEHPSFADLGNLPDPPGPARACNFGDNPLTPAPDPFACNNKLIGGQPFLATYLSNPARAEAEPFHTARDSNGHGTHTSSTTAGNMVAHAAVLGVDRGSIHGVAPGAHVIEYKVCGIQGCFGSDSTAAVQQAILDGVDVINFSISGGTDPFIDPVELAFLDAYAAGVFVSASAGNDGPGAGTVNHLSPWVTTVAASTQTREFATTLSLTAGNGDTFTADGASITAGAGPAPVVLSSAAPYNRPLCDAPAPAGSFTGKIVACQRGVVGRVEKGFNVFQGGAVGMILYNPALADVETDNHWLPTVHLADGTDFVAFMGSHTGVIGSFPAGEQRDGQGDVMAAFSSRGPGGLPGLPPSPFIKPDVTAPGVQILAGHTPFRESVLEGPPGEYFQAIAGTSMSSPHVAGAAILIRAVHPEWTPGQVKSALMTTALQDVVKEDLTTPADPFDFGSGRIDLTVAGDPAVTFDESAARFFALGEDPLNAVHLNIASINAPLLPGRLVTTRVATNTTDHEVRYSVTTSAPAGSSITVSPARIRIAAGGSATLTITVETNETEGTHFGEIRLTPTRGSNVPLHLPVAFTAGQGEVSLTQSCDPTTIPVEGTPSSCEVEAVNTSFTDATVDLDTTVTNNLKIDDADGATVVTKRHVQLHNVTLAAASPGVPSAGPGELFGYIPLDAFGVTPIPIGDEMIINFNVPAFVYNGVTYTQVGVDSNGYVIAGLGTSRDNNCCDLPTGPDPARPNNMLAPFWTDLDGTGAPGIFAAVLRAGVNRWLVFEYRVNVFGTTSPRVFQTWIGLNGTQDITYAYDPANLPADPNGQDFLVGAENVLGQGDMSATLPVGDLRVTSTAPAPGGSAGYTLSVVGTEAGTGTVRTEMQAPTVSGVTVVTTPIEVVP